MDCRRWRSVWIPNFEIKTFEILLASRKESSMSLVIDKLIQLIISRALIQCFTFYELVLSQNFWPSVEAYCHNTIVCQRVRLNRTDSRWPRNWHALLINLDFGTLKKFEKRDQSNDQLINGKTPPSSGSVFGINKSFPINQKRETLTTAWSWNFASFENLSFKKSFVPKWLYQWSSHLKVPPVFILAGQY